MKKLFFLLAFLSFAIVSCEKEPILTLSVEQIAAPANGNSTSVTVTTNNPWTVSGNDWCTVSPSSGEGGSVTVTVTVKENTTYDARSCTLTFASAGLTQSVSVSQESNYGVVLPKNMYEISSDTQQISVEVKANVDYDVTISADWIKQSGTKSLSSKTYLFDIEKNDTYDAREGIITIKEKNGSNTEVIKVKQAQKDAIIISSKEYAISSNAQELQIKLQTNVELEVVIPDNAKDWISYTATKALVDKTLVLNIKANEEYDARKCEIMIRKKNGRQSDTLKIRQAQKNAIIISHKDYNLTKVAQLLEISLLSNVDIEVIIPSIANTWISPVRTKSLDDKIIILSVQENNTLENRVAEVYIKDKQSALIDTIKVAQNYQGPADNEIWYVTSDKKIVDLYRQVGFDANIISNSYINNYGIITFDGPISVIAEDAFKFCKNLISVTIPESINKIGLRAFASTSVRSITIPKNVNSIGRDAFISCDYLERFYGKYVSYDNRCLIDENGIMIAFAPANLTHYDIPNGIVGLGDFMFAYTNLESVTIPSSVTSIGNYAFKGANSLINIEIPDSVTSIGEGAFSYCGKLKDVKIPKSVKSISCHAFYHCDILKSVTMDGIADYIGYGAFCYNNSLEAFYGPMSSLDNKCLINKDGTLIAVAHNNLISYDIPDNVTRIGENVFSDCKTLQYISVPEIKYIDYGAFSGCKSLKKVILTGRMKSIGSHAFAGCESLTDITMPEYLSSMGLCVFQYCI